MTVKELWRKIQLLLIIACGTYPIVMVLLNNLAPDLMRWGWIFSAAYVILSAAAVCVKGRLRMSAGIGLSAAFVILSALLSGPQNRLGAIATAAVCSGLLMWSLRMGGWSGKEEIPVFWVAIGMACHLLGQLLLRADRVAGGQGIEHHSGTFLAALFGFSLLTMLSMNRKNLTAASGKRQSVPDSMRRRNSLLTMVLFVLAVLASLLPSAFSGLSDWMGNAIAWLVRTIAALIPDAPIKANQQMDTPSTLPLDGIGQGGGGAMLNPVAEQIATFVGALISIAFVVFLLWKLYTLVREKLRELVTSLEKYASSVSEDYVDEITDTREDGTVEKVRRGRRGPKLSAREERNLPPGERIRYRYRRILEKHPEWEPGSTAREKLPWELARVYERARYSGDVMTEEEAAVFTGGTEHL